jgi:hypothetical protein
MFRMMSLPLMVLTLSSIMTSTPFAVARPASRTHFDDYGTIPWEDEKARLDNFAIQLQNDENLIGYILVVDAVGGCPGEAQARAIRAKRYLVEVRGTPWNRVIWKVEGHLSEVSTVLMLAPRDAIVPYPFRYTFTGKSGPLKDGPLTKRCQTRLQGIARSR